VSIIQTSSNLIKTLMR